MARTRVASWCAKAEACGVKSAPIAWPLPPLLKSSSWWANDSELFFWMMCFFVNYVWPGENMYKYVKMWVLG